MLKTSANIFRDHLTHGVPQVRDEFLEYFIPLMWCDLQKPFCKSQSKWRKCAFWGAKIILNDSNSLGPFHMPRQQMLASQGLSNWIPNQQMLRNSFVLLAPGPYSIFWPMPTCSSLDLAAATWHWRGQPQRWMLWLGNVGDRKKGHHDVWVYKLNLLQHDVYSYMEMSKIPQIKPAWIGAVDTPRKKLIWIIIRPVLPSEFKLARLYSHNFDQSTAGSLGTPLWSQRPWGKQHCESMGIIIQWFWVIWINLWIYLYLWIYWNRVDGWK